MQQMTGNGWDKLGNHVVAELARLSGAIGAMDEKNDEEHKAIRDAFADYKEKTSVSIAEVKAEVKYKSGVWGAIVAFLTTLGGLLIYFFITT